MRASSAVRGAGSSRTFAALVVATLLSTCSARPPDSPTVTAVPGEPGPAAPPPGVERGMFVSGAHGPQEMTPALEVALRSYGRRFAVAIGINAYGKGLTPLTAAVNDARRTAELLRRLGFDDVDGLEDRAATRAGILDLLEQRLPSKTGPNDLAVVFFAGHGLTEHERGYILPQDAGPDTTSGAISVQQLKETALRMKAKHVLFLVDACFSGSMLKRAAVGKGADLAFWEAAARERGVQILTAGGAKEVVFETDGWGNFTRALHAALEGGADLDRDGVTTFDELASFVDERVRRESRGAQHPQWGSVEGTGSALLWDVRRLPESARPKPRPVRPLVKGLENELRRVHDSMDRKSWAEAEKILREIAVRQAHVELNLLLAEVYLEQDALGNAAIVEGELRRVEAAEASADERRRALDLRARLEKAKRGSF